MPLTAAISSKSTAPTWKIFSNRRVPAVDQEVGAGHEACAVGGEEQRGLRDFIGFAQAVKQMLRAGGAARLVHAAVAMDHAARRHRAGRERVDPHVVAGVVDRHRLGELNDRAHWSSAAAG